MNILVPFTSYLGNNYTLNIENLDIFLNDTLKYDNYFIYHQYGYSYDENYEETYTRNNKTEINTSYSYYIITGVNMIADKPEGWEDTYLMVYPVYEKSTNEYGVEQFRRVTYKNTNNLQFEANKYCTLTSEEVSFNVTYETPFTTVTKNNLLVTSKISGASIEGTPSSNDEAIEFSIFFQDSGNVPMLTGRIGVYAGTNPIGQPTYHFENILSTMQQITRFDWDDIRFPNEAIFIKIYQKGVQVAEHPILLPSISASEITYNNAKITITDLSTLQNLVLFKENGNDERIKLINGSEILANTISLTNLEMGTDYVLWLDGNDGLCNILRFSTLGAPVWAKTDNGFQKGKLWVKTSEGWKKAKGIFGRKSVSDSWVKGK